MLGHAVESANDQASVPVNFCKSMAARHVPITPLEKLGVARLIWRFGCAVVAAARQPSNFAQLFQAIGFEKSIIDCKSL